MWPVAASIHEIVLAVASESDGAQQDLRALGGHLLALDATEAEAELKLDDRQFDRAVRDAHYDLTKLAARKVTVEVDADTNAAERALARLAAERARAAAPGGGGRGGTPNFGVRSGNLGPFNVAGAVMLRLLPLLITGMIGLGAAAFGLGSSLIGAIVGLGALGLAAAAATGPVVALAVAAITRFAGASEAADALRTATQGVNEAERSLTDAERQARFASDGLRDARHEAARQLRDELTAALRANDQAERGVADAEAGSLAAQHALNAAREQAVRTLQDMRAAAEGAAISEERAEIALERARNAARGFDKGDDSLRAREARLDVEDAENRLREARRTGQRSVEDLAEAERKGVEGSDVVVNARAALTDANQRVADSNLALADSNRDVARAQRAMNRPNEQVIAARRALQAANRAVADSERALTRAQREQTIAAREAASSSLGAAGKRLKQAGRNFSRVARRATDPAVDAIYRGIAGMLDRLAPMTRGLRDEFTGLGGAMGDAFREWGDELARPEWADFFARLIEAATRILPDFNGGLIGLARAFRNVVDAAMPFLEQGMATFREWGRGLGESSSDIDATSSSIGSMVDMLRTWWALLGEGSSALVNLGKGAAPSTMDWLDDMTASLRRWNEWASSTEGQARIQQFFDRMIPFARDLLGVVGRLGEAFVHWAELSAPALRPLLSILGRLLDFANDLLGMLNRLPGPLGDIASALAAYVGLRKIFGGRGGGVPVPLPGRGAPVPVPTGGPAGSWAKFTAFMRGKGGPIALGIEAVLIYDKLTNAIDEVGAAQDRADKAITTSVTGAGAIARQAQLDAIHAVQRAAGVSGDRALAILRKKFGSKAGAIPWERLARHANRPGGLAGKGFLDNAIAEMRRRRAVVEDVAGAIGKGAAHAALEGVRNVKSAGAAIANSIVEGIRQGRENVRRAARSLGQLIRDQFPGSEPRDPSSPLRRLDRAGSALVENFAHGIQRASARAVNNVRGELAGGLRAQLAGGGGAGGGSVSHNRFDMPLTVVGGGSPDPVATVAAVSRGLARKGLTLK